MFDGDTSDPKTLAVQISKLKKRFGLKRVVLVGDRGMITSARIEAELKPAGLDWITALRAPAIRRWQPTTGRCSCRCSTTATWPRSAHPISRASGWSSAAIPPWPPSGRASAKTCSPHPSTIRQGPGGDDARPATRCARAAEIALKRAPCWDGARSPNTSGSTITEETLGFVRNDAAIAREATLDGFYVLRTSAPAEALDASATVLAYKSLAHVERAFRSLKSIDLDIRPVHHRLAGRVRAQRLSLHARLLRPMADAPQAGAICCSRITTDRQAAGSRASPVARAQVSPAARAEARTRKTDDGEPVHSCRTLLADLATLTRNTVRFGDNLPMIVLSRPTPIQQRAFDLSGVALAP